MELDRGSAIFRVQNVYLGQRQAEVLVERLQARAAKGERWTAREQVEAILLPLMGRRHSLLALLAEVVEASAVLAKEERSNVLGSMVGLAYNYLEPGKAEQLLEALRKVNAFEELIVDQVLEGRAKGHAEGRAEGHAEGEQDAILRVLARRLGTVPMELAAQIRAQQDVQQLEVLLDAALDAEDMATFARLVRQGVPRA
jgi:flagellar biosynthesis/type III secretory pathway protein FliH